MPALVATVVNPVVGADGAAFQVEVRTRADSPVAPPRAVFPARIPLESNQDALRKVVEDGVKQAYQAYLDGQAAATRVATVQSFLTGKTLVVEV